MGSYWCGSLQPPQTPNSWNFHLTPPEASSSWEPWHSVGVEGNVRTSQPQSGATATVWKFFVLGPCWDVKWIKSNGEPKIWEPFWSLNLVGQAKLKHNQKGRWTLYTNGGNQTKTIGCLPKWLTTLCSSTIPRCTQTISSRCIYIYIHTYHIYIYVYQYITSSDTM